MLSKLRNNKEGFTLIELMIVIAIIGILAAIAIPNFISYRNKSFCSAAESDANNIAGAIADYYAVPNRTAFVAPDPTTAAPAGLEMQLTGANTGVLADTAGDLSVITITVTDVSTRCPEDYRTSQTVPADGVEGWGAGNTFIKQM